MVECAEVRREGFAIASILVGRQAFGLTLIGWAGSSNTARLFRLRLVDNIAVTVRTLLIGLIRAAFAGFRLLWPHGGFVGGRRG